MPTYEYTCRDCGHTFEVVQPMSDDPLTVCPICEGALRKVFAPPAIAFKGSGFYATDHGKKAKQSETSPEKGSDTEKGKDAGSSNKDAKATGSKDTGGSSSGGSSSSEGSSSSSSGGPSSSSGDPSTKKEATSS
jgi:putative FmdB family regulatory protein